MSKSASAASAKLEVVPVTLPLLCNPETLNPVTVAPVKSTVVPFGKSTLLEPLPIVTNTVCVAPMFTLPDVSAPLPPVMLASPPVLFTSVASPPVIAKSLPSATPAPTASASKLLPVKAPPAVSASVMP